MDSERIDLDRACGPSDRLTFDVPLARRRIGVHDDREGDTLSAPNITVLGLTREGEDSIVTVHVRSPEDRFFPPMLAAQLMMDVNGLVHQSCFSKPVVGGGIHAKEGSPRGARRWAFAQEIFSNEGRGTESGHFLEHLVLEMALGVTRPGRARRFAGETTWDWRVEPDRFHLRFFHMDEPLVRSALSLSASALSRHGYALELQDFGIDVPASRAIVPVIARIV